QASNKAESPVERPGFLFYLLFVGERSPEEDKSAGSGFERCAAPPPAKITPCSLHYLLSTQNKTPSWQSLRHNPLFPCPCAGDDRENRACEKKCESNHI
ncbi:hypothetical protein, partial [Klebsiella pneumoniae]|uniref:hypothetical protein n=1 Tax=Klebsiella pneumoniae TaxID=573 RepID=UPI001D0DFF51